MAKFNKEKKNRPAVDEDETDVQAVLEAYERERANQGKFKAKNEQDYYLKILPKKGGGIYYVPFGKHFDIQLLTPKAGDLKAVPCLKKTLDQDCPICDVAAKLFYDARRLDGSIDETKQKLAKAVRSNDRFVMNVIDMESQKQGVLTWEVPRTVHDKIRALFVEWGDITSPTKGMIVKASFVKKGDFGLVCENVGVTRKSFDIEIEDWREQRKDLELYTKNGLKTREELLDLLRIDDDDPDAPRSNKRNKKTRDPEPESEEPEEEEKETDAEEEGDDQSEDEAGEESEDEESEADIDEDDPVVQKIRARMEARERANRAARR